MIRTKLAGFLLLMGLSPLSTFAQGSLSDRYVEDNARVHKLPLMERKVILFGNSITDNWFKMRPDFFTSHGFIGRGISGETTYDFVLRFERDAVALRPMAIVFNGGTNDIAENDVAYDPETTYRNIISMVETAQKGGVRIVLASILPAESMGWNAKVTGAMEKIESLNSRLRAYADAHHILYVDYFPLMVTPDGARMRPEYTPDGVHPNEAGYAVMEDALLRALSPFIP